MNPEQILREYELCRNQAEVYQQNMELIGGNLLELQNVNRALGELKGTDKDSEMLVPIGADSFVKAKITDPENIIISIGASVSVKKSVEDAKGDIQNRIAELEKVKVDHTSNLEKLFSRLKELEPTVRGIVSQTSKKGE